MTEVQFDAIKRLVLRYKSDMEYSDVVYDHDGTGIAGLPPGWVLVNLCRPEEGKAPHLCNDIIVQAGVSPEGSVHT